jgi:hypothetical protein
MKLGLLLLLGFICSLLAIGQPNTNNIAIIKYLLENEDLNQHFAYTDRLDDFTIKYLKSHLGQGDITGYINSNDRIELKLKRDDRRKLHKILRNLHYPIFYKGDFSNATFLSVDSLWKYISSRKLEIFRIYKDSLNDKNSDAYKRYEVLRFEYPKVFQFSPLIRLDNNRILIFYFRKLCGSDCGFEDLSVYRLENGIYKKWFMISGAVY